MRCTTVNTIPSTVSEPWLFNNSFIQLFRQHTHWLLTEQPIIHPFTFNQPLHVVSSEMPVFFIRNKNSETIFPVDSASSFNVFFLNFLFPIHVNIRYSTVINAKDGTVLQAFLSSDEKWRMMAEPEDISPRLRTAILYKEDKYFYYHPGVNPIALIRAMTNNVFACTPDFRTSTITMQVARLLYPKKRTYINKCVELFRAFQLELYYSKDEILRMYFELVPYGGILKVKAAALLYYGRFPDKLSLGQLTTLAIIPNRPGSLRIGKKFGSVEDGTK